MGGFGEDEFLVALDDLHSPEIGAKKLVAAMKAAYPEREGINAKRVREALAVLRSPDGAATVASARRRVPKEEPKEEPKLEPKEEPQEEPKEEPKEESQETADTGEPDHVEGPRDDDKLFMTTQKEPRQPTTAPTPGPQPVFDDENDPPPAQDEDEDFSTDDEGFFDASPRGATSSEEEEPDDPTVDPAFAATAKNLTPTPLRDGTAEYDAPVATESVYAAALAGTLPQPSLFLSPADEAKAFLDAALADLVKQQPADPYAVLAQKCRAQAHVKCIVPKASEPQPEPQPQPQTSLEPQIDSVQEAVRIMKKYEDVGAMGIKRLVMEIKAKFPQLERNGIKVGAKEVRAAVRNLTTVGLDTPPAEARKREQSRKRVVTPPPVPPEIESEVQVLAVDGDNIYAGSPRPRGDKGLYAPTGLAGEVVKVGPGGIAASGTVSQSPPKSGADFLKQRKAQAAESPAAFSEDENEGYTDEFTTAQKAFSATARTDDPGKKNFASAGSSAQVQVVARGEDGEFLSGSPRGDAGARNLFAPTGVAGHVRKHSIDDNVDIGSPLGARGDSHGLVFLEQFAKSDNVEMQSFRHVVRSSNQERIATIPPSPGGKPQSSVGRDGKGSQPDSLVLCAGRARHVGLGPDYIRLWYSPGCGLERLDAWDKFSRSAAGQTGSDAKFRSVVESGRSGCYEALLAPVPAKTMEGKIYLVEWFDPVSPHVGGAAITEHFLDREAGNLPSENIQLNLLAMGIGALASGPGSGIAIWSLPNFASLEGMVGDSRQSDCGRDTGSGGVARKVEILDLGVYQDFGQEL